MQTDKIFKLDPEGESYRAVIEFQNSMSALRAEFQSKVSMESGLSDDMKAEIVERSKAIHADINEKMGFLHPVTQVKDNELQAYPRAYEHVPTVFANQYSVEGDDGAHQDVVEFYMFSPVGYDGDFFEPDDARLIEDEKEIKGVEAQLFAGGWLNPAVVISANAQGVEVPKDYSPLADADKKDALPHYKVCFVAQGETLDILQDFDQRNAEYGHATQAVIDHVNSAIQNDLAPEFNRQIEEGEDFYVNWSYGQSRDDKNKTHFDISVRQGGKVNGMAAGQPLIVGNNDIFLVSAKEGRGEYQISPNEDTPQGQELKALMDAVPTKPSLSDYPELVADMPFEPAQFDEMLGVNGSVPQEWEFQGHRVLTYNSDEADYDAFCPPDAQPLPSALYKWVKNDEEDERMGISPPPAPDALLDDVLHLLNDTPKLGRDTDENPNLDI